MSLYDEGLPVARVSFQRSPKSSLSSTFYQNLVGVRGNHLLFTTAIPSFSSYSNLVECNISHGLQTDVVLGLDWAVHTPESLIGSGYRLDSTFDPWPECSASAFLRLGNPVVINNWPVCIVLTCDAGLVNSIDTAVAGIWLNQVPDLSRLSGLTHVLAALGYRLKDEIWGWPWHI
ncbi:hypothetical protein B0H13DRAFT_1867163 [Mycena leptocephala]|nr:hypothetical protein B0H13DRAFT_1867163 [Mycena leptocephala]